MKPCIGLPYETCNLFAANGEARCPRHKRLWIERHTLNAEYRRNRKIVLKNARVCAICSKRPTSKDPLTCGHIISRANGGTNKLSNMQPEHRSCNSKKGSWNDT